MRNVTFGLQREAQYRTAMGGENRIVSTPLGNRQIDIYINDGSQRFAGQLKTGKQYLTQENIAAIQRDAFLKESLYYDREWIMEKGGSQTLLEELQKNGIRYHIGPRIP